MRVECSSGEILRMEFLEEFWGTQARMKNDEFENLRKFEEFENVDRVNGDESSTLLHARGHGTNVQVPWQHIRHAKM